MIGNRYRSAGGGIFFAEPVANYGFIFCGFVCIIYFCLVAWLIKKHRKYECLYILNYVYQYSEVHGMV